MDELHAMGVVEPQGGRAQVAALNCLRQDDHSYHDGQHRKSNVYNGLTCNGQHRQTEIYGGETYTHLWYRPISHVVVMHETDKSHSIFYKQKGSQTNERKAILDHGKRGSQHVNQFSDLTQYADPEHLELRDAQIPLRKDLEKSFIVSLSPVLPQR